MPRLDVILIDIHIFVFRQHVKDIGRHRGRKNRRRIAKAERLESQIRIDLPDRVPLPAVDQRNHLVAVFYRVRVAHDLLFIRFDRSPERREVVRAHA